MDEEMRNYLMQETERVENIVEKMFPSHIIKVNNLFTFKIATIENYLVVLSYGNVVFKRYCYEIDHIIKSEDVLLIVCYDYTTFQINLKEN